MRSIDRRLRVLERRFAPPHDSEPDLRLLALLNAARRRSGLPRPCPERLAEPRHLSIAEILCRGRQRVALARAEAFEGCP